MTAVAPPQAPAATEGRRIAEPDPFYRLESAIRAFQTWLVEQVDRIVEANPGHEMLPGLAEPIIRGAEHDLIDLTCNVGGASDNLRADWLAGHLADVELDPLPFAEVPDEQRLHDAATA